MADADLELGGRGIILPALSAFLPSVTSFFTQNIKKGGGVQAPSLDPLLIINCNLLELAGL